MASMGMTWFLTRMMHPTPIRSSTAFQARGLEVGVQNSMIQVKVNDQLREAGVESVDQTTAISTETNKDAGARNTGHLVMNHDTMLRVMGGENTGAMSDHATEVVAMTMTITREGMGGGSCNSTKFKQKPLSYRMHDSRCLHTLESC